MEFAETSFHETKGKIWETETKHQAPVVQKVDSGIQQLNPYPVAIQWIVQLVSPIRILWIVIYPVYNAIQLLNNWGLVELNLLKNLSGELVGSHNKQAITLFN